jgi:hypothetical protein
MGKALQCSERGKRGGSDTWWFPARKSEEEVELIAVLLLG